MDNRTERLAEGVWRIEVGPFVNTYLLAVDGRTDAEGLVLVDTGTPAAGPRLVRSVRVLGFEPRAVRHVLLTHWHADHAGSAARFASSSAAPTVRCGIDDLPLVRGAPPPVPARTDTSALGVLLARRGWLPSAPPVEAATGLADGEHLDVCGGLDVVTTPGHTPGSISFWLPSRGVALAGDALLTVGRPSRGPRSLSSARSRTDASLRRLAELDPATLAVGHGNPLVGDVRRRLEAVLAR